MTLTSIGPANRMARSAETHPLTWRLRDDEQPVWLDEYQSKNGYAGARKALAQMAPDDIVQAVKDSGLKGRGGAGFSTGLKWGLMPKDESMNIRYLLCNADEMEPGTYKDRLLMEQLPHLLVEGMLISARALKAYRGYIFLRGEYIEAARNLSRAIAEATAAGLLGKNILGSGFDFELFVHTGAGRYICGEETALINSLEGRRANPRSKPPFPASRRRLGQTDLREQRRNPVQRAGHRRQRRGVVQDPGPPRQRRHAGTKLMGFSGRVKNPGLWELPFGITAREMLEDYAGGMRDGLKLKAWQPGGAGTDFLIPEHLDAPMFAGGIGKAGSRLGTGAGDGGRPRDQHGVAGAQPGRVLRPRVLRLVYAVPRWSAVEREDPACTGTWRRPAWRYRNPRAAVSTSSARAKPSAPTHRVPSSRWRARSNISVTSSKRASPASLRPRRARQRSAPDALQPDGQPSGDVSSSCRGPAAGPTEP